MQGTKPPTFRPTVWPADIPEVPLIPRFDHAEIGDGLYEWAALREDVLLPPDFVLDELRDTATADAAGLIAFVNAWGPLVKPTADPFSMFRDGDAHDGRVRLQAAQAQLGRQDVIPIEALDLAARTLRAVTRHVVAYLESAGDDALVAAWTAEGYDVTTLAEASFRWEQSVDLGLRAFPMHVRAGDDDDSLARARATRPVPTLYDACCLQLVQYIANDATVRRCANERCGRPFTRQRGRAREAYGQHRSHGVKYCSHLCAKAQSERDRRRRRAEES